MLDKLRPDTIVYGPYTRKDGRKHIVLYWPSENRRQTVSYPKWLIEQHLGRFLLPDETVDHINRDFTDDRLENLQILKRADHAKLDAIRRKPVDAVCAWCNRSFTILNGLNHRGRGKAGPFCSRKCSGEYGTSVQNGRTIPKEPYSLIKEYIRLNKAM